MTQTTTHPADIGAIVPSRIEYTRRYSDDSGVEIGVIYDGDDGHRPFKIVATDTADFSAEHLDFVIASLCAVRAALQEAGSNA